MRNQGQIFIGGAIILVGLVFLIGNAFHIDVGVLCMPLALILLGVWLLLRPYLVGPDTALGWALFGPLRRSGDWQVTDEEFWLLVGDVILDFTQADIPAGETVLRLFGFVGNVRLHVPEGVGVAVSSLAFFTEAKILGKKRSGMFGPLRLTSEGYGLAERKIRLELTFFVADVKTKQA